MPISSIHPRLRYSLRTLFALMLVVALGSSWYGQQIYFQDRALRQIAARGGTVLVYPNGVSVSFRAQPGRVRLSCPGLVRRVYGPQISPGGLTANDLAVFDQVSGLRNVDFSNSGIPDEAAIAFRESHPHCRVSH